MCGPQAYKAALLAFVCALGKNRAKDRDLKMIRCFWAFFFSFYFLGEGLRELTRWNTEDF